MISLFEAVEANNLNELATIILETKSKKLFNRSDCSGRTLLMTAISMNCLNIVKLLCECKSVDINRQDYESGYTALHRALYQGKLLIAVAILRSRMDVDLYIRDHEGNSCLDLLNSTISKPAFCSNDSNIYSIHVWGSNKNFNLGKQVESIQSPELLELKGISKGIKGMSIGKYHTAILLENGQLYINGFSGSRLGFSNQETVIKPRLVDIPSIQQVALGYHHTVALSNGIVYTWGSNKYGQLGYAELEQQSPRKVGSLNHLRIEYICASKYHTVAATSTFLYTWGFCNGQLGYNATTQYTPRRVTEFIFNHDINQVSCTNSSTAVLVGHEVFVFASNNVSKVSINPSISLFPTRNYKITSIVSGNHHYCALTSDGDVFAWAPPIQKYKYTWQYQMQKPVLVWTARRNFQAAKSVAIGLDSLLIVTRDGHVYQGQQNNKQFKFNRVPGLQDIQLVSAGISGSFSCIKLVHRSIKVHVKSKSTSVDCIRILVQCSNGQVTLPKLQLESVSIFAKLALSELWLKSPILVLQYRVELVEIFKEWLSNPSILDSINEYQLVVDVFILADYLLADSFKSHAETVLINLISLENCIQLMQLAFNFNSKELFDNCVLFFCYNLEFMIESRLITTLDDHLIVKIQEKLQKLQREKFPEAFGYYEMLKSNQDRLFEYWFDEELEVLIAETTTIAAESTTATSTSKFVEFATKSPTEINETELKETRQPKLKPLKRLSQKDRKKKAVSVKPSASTAGITSAWSKPTATSSSTTTSNNIIEKENLLGKPMKKLEFWNNYSWESPTSSRSVLEIQKHEIQTRQKTLKSIQQIQTEELAVCEFNEYYQMICSETGETFQVFISS